MRLPERVRFYVGPIRRYAVGALTPRVGLPRPLLIFTSGRAGSELLVTLLNSHPMILCDSEILQRADRLPRLRPYMYIRGTTVVSLRKARQSQEAPQVYGWKLASTDLRWHQRRYPDPAEFLRHATGRGGMLIVLRRHNFVAQALSYLHAESTQYHFRNTDGAPGFQKMWVDPEQLLAQTWIYESEDQWIAELTSDLDRLDLFYEDDLLKSTDQQKTADRITDALGLSPARVDTILRRVSPLTPAERIENIDEVRSVFAPTRYARFLD